MCTVMHVHAFLCVSVFVCVRVDFSGLKLNLDLTTDY